MIYLKEWTHKITNPEKYKEWELKQEHFMHKVRPRWKSLNFRQQDYKEYWRNWMKDAIIDKAAL